MSKGTPKNKLVVGMATYGRTFTLANPSQNGVGAPATGAGPAGQFTRENGFLSYYEVNVFSACVRACVCVGGGSFGLEIYSPESK